MKKIAIFQDNLKFGGIQKSLLNLLRNIDLSKYEIDLYLFSDKNDFMNQLPKEINIVYLKPFSKITKFMFFGFFKNSTIDVLNKEYDVAIDFNSYQHYCALGALNSKAKKRVMWIHNDVEIKLKEELKYRILHFFSKSKYKLFDEFVGVSPGVVEPFKKVNKVFDKKCWVIPNYIDTKEIIDKCDDKVDLAVDSSKYNLVSVGRLCHQKGFDILLDMLKKLEVDRKDFHFYLIGDGEERSNLEKRVFRLQLENYVTFLGAQANPFKYMKLMDGFVLTSRYEGQGMVFWEAKALGLKLFMPKNLEIYNVELKGMEDILLDLKNAKKSDNQKIDMLIKYNTSIINEMDKMINKE